MRPRLSDLDPVCVSTGEQPVPALIQEGRELLAQRALQRFFVQRTGKCGSKRQESFEFRRSRL
jgi:hypothetical protein